MLKNLKIGYKIHIPLIVSMVLATIVVVVNSCLFVAKIEKEVYGKEKNSLSIYFDQKFLAEIDAVINLIRYCNDSSAENKKVVEEMSILTKQIYDMSEKLYKMPESYKTR